MNIVTDRPEKLSVLDRIKKLDEERAQLLEGAKKDALDRASLAIEDLKALGFKYRLVEDTDPKVSRKPSATGSRSKNGSCGYCGFATDPPHDRRAHKAQPVKRPFTDEELKELHLVKV